MANQPAPADAAALARLLGLDPAAAAPATPVAGLTRLLAGQVDDLEPWAATLEPEPAWHDARLDPGQRAAVRRALQAPDFCLLQGAPGTGKSRVVAELLAQAVGRGQRTLFVAPDGAALDRALEPAVGHLKGPTVVRVPGPNEPAKHLPAALQPLTPAEQAQRLLAAARERAQQAKAQAADALRRAEADLGRLQQLRPLAAQWQEREEERNRLTAARARLAAEVREEAGRKPAGPAAEGTLARAVQDELSRHQATQQELDAKVQAAQAQVQEKQQELEKWAAQTRAQQATVELQKQRRWLSLAWWRAFLQGRAAQRLAEFQARADEAREALTEAQKHHQEQEAQKERERQRHETALDQIVTNEAGHRQGSLDQQLAEVDRQRDGLRDQWLRLCGELAGTDGLPGQPSLGPLDRARQAAEERRDQARKGVQQAEADARLVADAGPAAELFAARADLVAAPLTLGPKLAALGTFDLVIVEQADRVSVADLEAVTAQARRWVLVGRPRWPLPPGPRRRPHPDVAEEIPAEERPFHRLWHWLHADPGRTPVQWVEEGDRLTCQRFPITAVERDHLEGEPVTDRPDVELCILNAPERDPEIAEVRFPAGRTPIAEAKLFVYRELDELAIRPEGLGFRWHEAGGQSVLEVVGAPAACGPETRIALETGVAEVVQPVALTNGTEANGHAAQRWCTVRLEFDPTAGWDRRRAMDWLWQRAGLRALGRTASLDVLWRSHPEIVSFWTAVLGCPGGQFPPDSAERPWPRDVPALPAPVEFIPTHAVEARPARPSGGKPGRQAPPARPEPAGEIDLAETRQRQRLPLDLQLKLPLKGLVNLAEAQALLKTLEVIAAGQPPLAVAVLSWQPAQVLLLETLWNRSGAKAVGSVRFATAAAFREAEADVVLVSLCRSTDQGDVIYTDEPEDWRNLLTGTRTSLLLFGDPATLARCAQAKPPGGETVVTARLTRLLRNPPEPSRLVVVRERAMAP